MAAARKTTAPRKRAAPKAAPEPSPRRAQIEAFEELRERARTSGLTLVDPGPYKVPGFDPPVYIRWPKSLVAREELHEATRRLDVFGTLRIVLGADYPRVLTEFDKLPDGEVLMIGLYRRMIEHFNGPGAPDAPGGSPAS